jgi:L-asparaginase
MNSTEPIQIFVTGGTFDKEYDYITGTLYFRNTFVPAMLERGRCTLDFDVKTLMMVDSLQMTDADRTIILENCKNTKSNQILITHGTDTMDITAKVLAEAGLDKVIVITGAMVPYAFGSSSDGFFNLGAALAYIQTKPNGVYIAMNGKIFDWDKVFKNRETGYFLEKNI